MSYLTDDDKMGYQYETMNDSSPILIALFDDIEHRVNTITQAQPAWPCHQGCASCCQRLPFLPEITKAEWTLLYEGFQQLPISVKETVKYRLFENTSKEQHDEFVTCPLLDREKGECLLYAYRPAACRMYGFYVSRGSNHWCEMIQERYEAGFADWIVLGNQQAIDREMVAKLGESKSIALWAKDML